MSTEELIKRLWDEIGALREQNAGLMHENADLRSVVAKMQEQDARLRQAVADAEARIAELEQGKRKPPSTPSVLNLWV